MKNTIKLSIFAGICIGIAGLGFLTNKTIGMFLFIFGLATIIKYQLKLFTGTAGFIINKKDLLNLLLILLGNLIGCLLISFMSKCSFNDISNEASILLINRLSNGLFNNFILSIGCGILMTTSVTFARKSNEFGDWIPLLFAIPLFILCGFPHCIADAFYYMCVPFDILLQYNYQILLLYIVIIIGNFIGCNIYRIFL